MNNVELPVRGAGLLPYLGVLCCAGPDAITFLQGQLSNDMRRLAKAQPLLAAYSTPQGRVVAVMQVLPHSRGMLAVMPRDVVLPTLERLRKFVMRAKVQLQDVSDEFAVAGADDETLHGGLDYVETEGVGVARVGGAQATPDAAAERAADGHAAAGHAAAGHAPPAATRRVWWVGARPVLEARIAAAAGAYAAPAAAGFERAWRLADIRSGLAQIYLPTREMFVPQMLNLDLVDGISFSKGCYTGQEIVARTQHLGRIKRRLHRLRLPAGDWAVGQTVHLDDGRTGRLTEVAPVDRGYEALAVLGARDPGNEPGVGPAGAVDAVELPLPYALTQDG